MNLRFRHLAAFTTALTFALILIGVYTGAIGAGLTCGARWPFCDGWLGLFPANWASFVEWFHRFVAMITGFFVVGTTYAAWRGDHERRLFRACLLATVVLPVQFLLGANTIFNFGPLSQVLHHTAALVMLVALVAATLWAYEERATRAGGGRTAEARADARVE